MRLLAVDVGNTQAKFGLYSTGFGNHQSGPKMPGWHAQSTTSVPLGADSLDQVPRHLHEWVALHSDGDGPERAALATSNRPAAQYLLDHWPDSLAPVRCVQHFEELPLRVEVDFPERVGMDRLLNAVAALQVSEKSHQLIVSSGTATTVDLVTDRGHFRGGAIMAGPRIASQALHDFTAALPFVDPASATESGQLPGRNTEAAIRAGFYFGHRGAVRELVNTMAEQLEDGWKQLDVLISGGGSEELEGLFPHARTIPHLSLLGIACVAAN